MQLFTALAILTAAGLGFASPSGEIAPEKRFTSVKTTSSDLTLDKRFPGCIDSNGNDVACSCTCESGWQGTWDEPVEQGQYAICQETGTSYAYGPVGCAAAPTNDGGLICEAKGCAYVQGAEGDPEGCYCCTTSC